VLRAAVEGVDAGGLVRRAVAQTDLQRRLTNAPTIDVVAAGKAAAVMLAAFAEGLGAPPRSMIAIGPAPRRALIPAGAEWFGAGHPLPTEGSVAGARRALELAAATSDFGLLVVLLSGGGSALMALPVSGVALEEKQATVRTLLEQGADIHELNTVRKHLSRIKGGQLAAAARGRVLTLAVSDVVGDDLSVIASGPTVPDPSTYHEALAVLARRGGRGAFPEAVVSHLERGAAGMVPETPKPGETRLSSADAHIIGPQRGALVAAQQKAEALGYAVRVAAEPVTGEARVAGAAHVERARELLAGVPRPACLLASGETTVTVVGTG
jgi:glycerate 2-kinase